MNFYRFLKYKVEGNSLLKGEDSWYRISDADEKPLWAVRVAGNCLGGTTRFHASGEDPRVSFRLEPKRKFMNLTYFVGEGEGGPVIATIRLKASRGMQVTSPTGEDVFSIVDPAKPFDKFMQTVLGGCCTEYAVAAGREVVGEIERRRRPVSEGVQPAGPFGRLRRKIFGAIAMEWCVELAGDGSCILDHRPLLAAMILLQEQTIRLDQSVAG
jgi:hypothetical protein